jgi:hypothetical protein
LVLCPAADRAAAASFPLLTCKSSHKIYTEGENYPIPGTKKELFTLIRLGYGDFFSYRLQGRGIVKKPNPPEANTEGQNLKPTTETQRK